MKKNTLLLLLLLSLAACERGSHFEVSGTIADGGRDTLYVEQLSLRKTLLLDSVVLPASGKFCFRLPSGAYPELYRLRLRGRQWVFAVDSTETIRLMTSRDSLAYADAPGSESTRRITCLRRALVAESPEVHKDLAKKYILENPRSIEAYFALFQQRKGAFVFDVYDKTDRVYYSAVATAWHAFMPDSERSKMLYTLVSEVIREERLQQNRLAMQAFIEQSDNAFLDITLPDENGLMQSLSDMRGQVILLDFSAFEMEQSTAYIFEMRELYNKYHSQGLEIYQVSADNNRLLWEQSVDHLPWTTVRSEYGGYASCFRTYNVQSIPTTFLLNRKGEVVGRNISFDQLPAAIEQCLR
ncbi:MAG: TlpA family protein disulfide reductase [Paludibacter sp.]|nr:TlpA family protein disulfide reductase [Bacteroidales bacterium]MCM1069693.1 TlpA family protein disulfide reductase [Prevotella sp.]MCM1354399.1 TlpA family protein disulfide reductase [Bacteroides sp.]MCM1441946.1 TlpA family protein disulfide reductase [Muribaculum sp.]MCM1482620.1 TlpA family protein disulfide reductase [Paludibacter sp.]